MMAAAPTTPASTAAPWLHSYSPSNWVWFLQLLSPTFPCSAIGYSLYPGVLLFCGLLASLYIIVRPCCCSPRGRSGEVRGAVRPEVSCVVFLGLVTVILAVAGTVLYLMTGSSAAALADQELTRAIGDVSTARSQGASLQTAGHALLAELHGIPPLCPGGRPGARKTAESAIAKLEPSLNVYVQKIDDFSSSMEKLPEQLEDVQKLLTAWSALCVWVLTVPMVLVVLCLAGLLSTTLLLRTIGCSRECTGCCLRGLGPLSFAPAVLLICGAAGTELWAGIMASSLCIHADQNAVNWIERAASGDNSTASGLSAYYIQGTGTNPIDGYLKEATLQINSFEKEFAQYSKSISTACPAWHGASSVTGNITSVHEGILVGQKLFEPSNVYPYYQKIVHEGICTQSVEGLGWLVIFQVLVGLFCLPTLSAKASDFLYRWSHWHADTRQPLTTGEIGVGMASWPIK